MFGLFTEETKTKIRAAVQAFIDRKRQARNPLPQEIKDAITAVVDNLLDPPGFPLPPGSFEVPPGRPGPVPIQVRQRPSGISQTLSPTGDYLTFTNIHRLMDESYRLVLKKNGVDGWSASFHITHDPQVIVLTGEAAEDVLCMLENSGLDLPDGFTPKIDAEFIDDDKFPDKFPADFGGIQGEKTE